MPEASQSEPIESIERAALDHAISSVPRPAITQFDEPPSAEAEAIGRVLAERPPWGFHERYSDVGWAHIAEGVLRAKAELDAQP